jgi:hypothetical protein
MTAPEGSAEHVAMKKIIGMATVLLLIAMGLAFLRGERATPTGVSSPADAAQDDARAKALLAAPEASREDLRAQASAPGPASAAQAGEAERGEGTHADDEELGCVVFGRVTEPSGEPLDPNSQCHLGFEDATGNSMSVRVRKDGAYSISGLAPDRWLVSADPPGYRRTKETLEIPRGVRSLRHDIVLQRATLVRVRLTAPDGRPFWDAARESGDVGMLPWSLMPIATSEPLGPTFEGVSAGRYNHYGVGQLADVFSGLRDLPPEYCGAIVLDGDPPVYVSLVLQAAVLATKHVAAGGEEVAFVLAPDTLLATRSTVRVCLVRAGTREPIERAGVSLVAPAFMAHPVPTDAQGCVVLSDRSPGDYVLWVLVPGLEQVRRSLTLMPGETLDLGTLELAEETWISGRLVDGEGKGIEAPLELGIVDPATRAVAMIKQQRWTSDRRGVFRIAALGRAEYVIRTPSRESSTGNPAPAGATANHLASTLGGPVEDLELNLLPLGRLLLRCERPDWQTLRFQALDAQELERAGGRLWDAPQQAVILPQGSYRVVVRDAEGETVLERAIEVGEMTVVLEVPPD